MKHIIQYKNRKLYHDGTYTNLEEIKETIKSGEQVQVTDRETGEDVTAHILSQVLVKTKHNFAEQVRQMIIKGE